MLFNSFSFLVFFVVVTGLYFYLPHRFRWILLLTASCYFYMAFVPVYILILGFTILVDYFAGIWIEQAEGRKRLLFLICSLVANIGILALFKYYNFINHNISLVLGAAGQRNPIPFLNILLPIGLSFHTFQAMSYTIEVYRGKQPAERHFGIYALYVMFYPQLVAGPIERPQNIIHQFYEKHEFDYRRVTDGLKLMLWGFFKKVLIADNLAMIVNEVYGHHTHYHGMAICLAMVAFTIQIYCDFSGYSDIAIGAAQVMGFKLMTNFRRPYLASSVGEFWTRWHISLSTWFRDYVYIPLGGSRVAVPRWCLNTLIVFLISGLWHGANWTFVLWGALHAAFLIFGKLTAGSRSRLAEGVGLAQLPGLRKGINIALTFIVITLAWVFFRAAGFAQARYMLQNLFTGWHLADAAQALTVWVPGLFYRLIIVVFIGVMIAVQHYQERYGSAREALARQHVAVRWGAYLFLVLSIMLFGAYEELSFIYFQF